jgi:hypothetical protein
MNYAVQTLLYIIGLGVLGMAVGLIVRRHEHREGRK